MQIANHRCGTIFFPSLTVNGPYCIPLMKTILCHVATTLEEEGVLVAVGLRVLCPTCHLNNMKINSPAAGTLSKCNCLIKENKLNNLQKPKT